MVTLNSNNKLEDRGTSNPCFTGAADPDYVRNVKLFLENVERSMFDDPESFGDGLEKIQALVARQARDADSYNLTVNLVRQYGNGRFSHFELPEPAFNLH